MAPFKIYIDDLIMVQIKISVSKWKMSQFHRSPNLDNLTLSVNHFQSFNAIFKCLGIVIIIFCVGVCCSVCVWVFQCGRLYNSTVYKYITLPFFIRFSNFILFNVPELYQCSPPWLCPLLLPREILEVQRRKGWLFKRRKKGNFF